MSSLTASDVSMDSERWDFVTRLWTIIVIDIDSYTQFGEKVYSLVKLGPRIESIAAIAKYFNLKNQFIQTF